MQDHDLQPKAGVVALTQDTDFYFHDFVGFADGKRNLERPLTFQRRRTVIVPSLIKMLQKASTAQTRSTGPA